MDFVSQIEPKKIDEAIVKEHRSLSMQQKLNQFERNNIWKPIPKLIEWLEP